MDKKYTEAVGRRKTATARVRVIEAAKTKVTVNDRPANEYFKTSTQIAATTDPIVKGEVPGGYEITAKVVGGGPAAQAEAIRHGLSRALTKIDPDLRSALKKLGFLKRDPRAKERKKPGLKGARKARQWSKR